MPTYQQLNIRRDPEADKRVEKLRALYLGGEHFEQQLNTFLPQRPKEPLQTYSARKAEAHYQNYIGPIVDFFAAMLFASRPLPIARKPGESVNEADPGDYYNAFRGDCDGTGTDIDAFFHAQFTEAMVAGKAWHRIHQPTSDGVERSFAEFERLKLGDCWIEKLESCEVFDWEVDAAGNLEWVLTHETLCKRTGPGDDRSSITEVWHSLTEKDIETFSITYQKDKPPAGTDSVPSTGIVPHTFGQVPVMCIDLPPGLWVTNRLESPQLAHFRASNKQDWSMSQTCYAMPVFNIRDPDTFEQRMGAGYGIYLEENEKAGWTAPPGDHFAALEARIETHKDEIFRIGHQMALGVENNSAAIGRTAESKMADAQITRVVLIAFAKAVKEAMARTYNAISAARGDKFEWSIGGLDEFASTDLLSYLTALTELKGFGTLPSRTAMVQIWTKAVDALLPELDEKTKAIVRREIEKNTPEPDPTMTPEMQLHTLAAGLTNGGSGPGTTEPAATPKPPSGGKAGGRKPPKAPSN